MWSTPAPKEKMTFIFDNFLNIELGKFQIIAMSIF